MALISIQERGEQKDGWRAVVRFNHGPENTITIQNPFSDEQEKELGWYFEQYTQFPFTQKVRAQKTAASIVTYGERLFEYVFENRDVYADNRELVKAGLTSLHIEIEGTPNFHALHWEALKDPKFAQPLGLQANMLRKNLRPQALPASIRPSPTINLLVVVARTVAQSEVGYRTISRPLVESLRNANVPVQVDILRPGTFQALENHLRATTARHGEGYYHVIHFDVHGAVLSFEQLQKRQPVSQSAYNQRYARAGIQPYEGSKAFLFFESEGKQQLIERGSDLVEASELATLLAMHKIPISILNACQSGKQVGERETSLGSYLVQAGAQLVLAMGYSITVSAAEKLMQTLYLKLFEKEALPVAIRHARSELYNQKGRVAWFKQRVDLEDWLLPVVYQNQPITLQPRDFTPQERSEWFERKAVEREYTPPDLLYGFVGRDLDILQIEKRLLDRRNMLLVRGMGGSGKTTLLRHLGWWWHTTGFVRRVFYFGYDDKAWTLQQIMTSIAQTLYGPRYYTDFQPLSPAAQQAMLAQTLRAEKHLLILDNLESITGAHLAIQHTLLPNEQNALRGFLAELAQGHTRALLGSRGSEDWLARGTFADNLYDLPGLDPEAASMLAERILERNHATQYRQDPHLLRLLELLDGCPLALEVVLANLAHQTPTNVLAALQSGDEKIDSDANGKDQQQAKSIFKQKTESILRCIDYSHSKLSPQAQQLLLCLAPFTSVIWVREQFFKDYLTQLRQQPALAAFQFDQWPEVMREAQNWGLLTSDQVPDILLIQPILPYFLRNRLQGADNAAIREAIETAFRLHYDGLALLMFGMAGSQDTTLRKAGQALIGKQYENLVTALDLTLAAQQSINNLYYALTIYLDSTQEQQRNLELGLHALAALEKYPPAKLIGSFGSDIVHGLVPVASDIVSVIDKIASLQLDLKQYEEAEASYQKALSMWQEQTNYYPEAEIQKLSAPIYHQLGMVAQMQRRWPQAERYYQQALQIYLDFDERSSAINTYHQLGDIAREQRRWPQAEQRLQKSLQLAIEFKNTEAQARAYLSLGLLAQDQGLLPQAETYYLQALQILIKRNERYEQSYTYHQLGTVAQEQRQWQEAEQYYQQALQIRIEYDDRYNQAATYGQLGILASEQDQWEQAEQYYQQALQIFIAFGERYQQAVTYHKLGMVAFEQQSWQQAENHYRLALQLYGEYDDLHAQADSYAQLGLVALAQEQLQPGREYLLKALGIYASFQDERGIHISMNNLALLWEYTSDASLPATIASTLGISVEETVALLRETLAEDRKRTGGV